MKSSSSIRPLTTGTALSASTHALTKNDIKPSLTPFFFVNASCLLRCLEFCLGQVVLLRRCGERRVKEVFLSLAPLFSLLRRPFSQPQVPSFLPQVLSSFLQALPFSVSPPSFLPVAALNHRLWQPLPRSSPPGLRALWFRAGRLSPRRSGWKPCRSRA